MLLPGLVSITFRALITEEIIRLCVAHGLLGIEWGGDRHVPHGNLEIAREVGRQTREAGLQVSAYGSYFRLQKSEEEGLTFSSVLETALALQAPTIRLWAGTKASQAADATYWAKAVAEARHCAEQAAAQGVTVSFEMHGQTLTDCPEAVRRFFREAAHPALFSYWQPFNGASLETCLESLELVAPLLSNVHAFHWWPTNLERHPLAEGKERWQHYLARLAQLSGSHFVSLEFLVNDDPALLSREVTTLRNWLAEAA